MLRQSEKAFDGGAEALLTKPIDFTLLRNEKHAGRTRRMSARILIVDDEQDVEALILQKFRQKIRDGTVSFLSARGPGYSDGSRRQLVCGVRP
jgi:hypothetical protein